MASHMQTVQIQLPDVFWYMINDSCFLCPRVSRGVGSQQMLSIWIKRPRSQLYATQSYQNALNCWIKQTSRVERMDPVSTERQLTWVCHPTQTSSEALSPSSPASPHRHPPSHFSLPPQTAACKQRNKYFRSRKKGMWAQSKSPERVLTLQLWRCSPCCIERSALASHCTPPTSASAGAFVVGHPGQREKSTLIRTIQKWIMDTQTRKQQLLHKCSSCLITGLAHFLRLLSVLREHPIRG